MHDILQKPKITNFKTQYLRKPKILESNVDNVRSYTSYKNENVNDIKNSYSNSFSIKNYDLEFLQKNFERFYLDVEKWLSNNQDIFECINILNKKLNDENHLIFIQQLNETIQDHINTSSECISSPMSFYSFKQLIFFSLSTKIQNSEIRIDSKTGKFCLFFSDKNDYKSRKISLVFNEKDVIYSVLSRDYGLAKLSGRFMLKQPIANHKIDLLMDLFKF